MVLRARTVCLALLAALAIPLVAQAAGPTLPPRGRPMPVGRDLLQEALARRGLSRPIPRVLPSAQRRLGVSSTYSSCGVWSFLNGGGFEMSPSEPPVVYDSARDRMLIIGTNTDGTQLQVWALTMGATPTLTPLDPLGWNSQIPLYGAAIYDPVRDRVVICGNSTQVYELTLSDPPTWNDITPDGDNPGYRTGNSAIYDATRDRLVMFGGYDGSIEQNSVWALNFSGTPAWTQLTPSGTPPVGRDSHAAVYDGARDRMVIFGGSDGTAYRNDTWALSLAGAGAWSQIQPSGTLPSTRGYLDAVVDVPRDRMLIFGGWTDQATPLVDVWRLSLTGSPKWTQVSPTGTVTTPIAGSGSAYDPVRQQMISAIGDEVWSLGNLGGTPAWSELNPPGQDPLPRYGTTTIYDTPRHRVVLFGGAPWPMGGLPSHDLWSLSLPDSTWTRIIASGTPPPSRLYASAVFDPAANRMIVFGGAGDYLPIGGSTTPLNDTWSLSLSGTPTWTHLSPSGTAPPARYAHTAILDAPRNRMIVYGGSDANGNPMSDVWSLSLSGGTSWSHLTPTGTSAAREYHTAIFDAPRDRMLALGWSDNSVSALALTGTLAWSTVTTAGTPPPTLVGQQAAYDAVRDRMLVSASFVNYTLNLSGTPTWGLLGSPDPMLGANPGYASAYDTGDDRWLIYQDNGATYALSFPAMGVLSLAAQPTVGGTVAAMPGGECQVAGSQVQIAATPAPTYGFTGWSGDASGATNPLTVTMNANKTITANFATYALTTAVAPTGSGSIARNPNLPSYPPGSQVTLTAVPAAGYGFTGWSGDATGTTNPITVTMVGPKTITANFIGFPVTTRVSPAGTGTVTRNPNQAAYPPGSQVVLTASNSPYPFLGWSGDATGSENPLTVTVDGPKDITANFQAYTVTVSAAPGNGGNVARSPSQSFYGPGAQVTLTATPAEGYAFTGWSGDTSGTANPLAMTVYANRNIVADFGIPPPGCGTWSTIASDTVPSPRVGTSAVWDPLRHRIVVFGGYGYSPAFPGGYGFLDEVWALTAAGGWTHLAPAGTGPSGRDVAGMVYDPGGDRLIIVGGNNASGFQNDAWQLSLAGTPTWSALAPTGTPPSPRFESSAIYDPIRDRVLVFGGLEAVTHYHMNDVWALNLSGTPNWTLLSPGNPPPLGRRGHVAVYDPVRDRMLMVGGWNGINLFNDLWALTLAGTPGWSQLGPLGTIPSRFEAQAIYDPVRDRMLLVGGRDPFVVAYGDVWSLSLKVQPMVRKLSLGGVLGARYFFSAVYEPETDLLVAIDGASTGDPSGYRTDSKRLDCAGGWWLEDGGDYGTVAASPLKTCYGDGEVVTLTASSLDGHAFLRWLGDFSGGQTPVDVTMDGSKTILAQFTQYAVGVEDAPKAFALEAIRPNPNRGPVEMTYALPVESRVRLRVYDIAGRVVADLVEGMQPAGRHVAVWDGTAAGASLRTGIYLARLETPAGMWTRRIVLIH